MQPSFHSLQETVENLKLDELAALSQRKPFIAIFSRPAHTDKFIGIGHSRTLVGVDGKLFLTEATVDLKSAMPDIYRDLKRNDIPAWWEKLRLLELRVRGLISAHPHQIHTFVYPDTLADETNIKSMERLHFRQLTEHTPSVIAIDVDREEALKWLTLNSEYAERDGKLYNVLNRHGGISCSTYPLMLLEITIPGIVSAMGIHSDALGTLAGIRGVWSTHVRQAARRLVLNKDMSALQTEDGLQIAGYSHYVKLGEECRGLFIAEAEAPFFHISQEELKQGASRLTGFEVLALANEAGLMAHFNRANTPEPNEKHPQPCEKVDNPDGTHLSKVLRETHKELSR